MDIVIDKDTAPTTHKKKDPECQISCKRLPKPKTKVELKKKRYD